MDRGSLPKALELLQPLAEQGGVVGKEAKELIGRLRIRQLLDPNGPDVKKYTVRKGDSWIRMVRKLGCSQAMVVHLNGLMDIPLFMREMYSSIGSGFPCGGERAEKEICLYDGTDFVKGYPSSHEGRGEKECGNDVKDEQAPCPSTAGSFLLRIRRWCWRREAMSLTLLAVRPLAGFYLSGRTAMNWPC